MKNALLASLQDQISNFADIADLTSLMTSLKDKKVVMLGEASHGTHEYYLWRAKISKVLIEEYGFNFVAVEGDWPPCYHVNRHVKNYEDAPTATYKALQAFERWPSWMWANWEVFEWTQWLRKYNKDVKPENRIGWYGLDVYSLWESLEAIMGYLQKEDPDAFQTAKEVMRCFEPYRDKDGGSYAFSTRLVPDGCQREVNKMLVEIRKKFARYEDDDEAAFSTEQNAIVAKNAEAYYRVMATGDEATWNIRDGHMMDTLTRLLDFHGPDAKGIVWAHNTHVGDASFTDMADQGLYNIGELARKQFGKEQVALIGFGSYQGSVLAGREWGAKVQKMEVPTASQDSWESMCAALGDQFYLNFEKMSADPEWQTKIPHRAIGVVYRPEYEQYGNYVPTVLPKRYDGFLFFKETKALHAMDSSVAANKTPETYPFGV
ncbi:protein-L-isoaspartate O-methyltransferase [Marixanthomonas spongiae]|uniref:Protein-L-isoaspartate O-methyltransferase n=2 Tax=Marixanthomonas spongiae TaxID=2174845 RepID=A0A2U0I626_9FLAO|nr:protein-L-isoaspartate O-methyltransferase [Marixanthomonas spongiae]